MTTASDAAVADRIRRSRRRRRAWLRAARVATVIFIASAVWATISYAQDGSLSTEFSLAFLSEAAVLCLLLGMAEGARCPACGGDPLPFWSAYAWHTRVCPRCGLDLYSDEKPGGVRAG